ncbi:MAG: prepilin-type N-terminal cleavage/methylation domain-containing protein [Armatimonadota bacterium]
MQLSRGRAPRPKGGWGAPRSAFTLVEMIVVVAIILLLSAMLFPVFEAALGRAEGVSCISNMRSLGLAARMYADDYDDTIIPAMLPHGTAGRICWDMTIQAYVSNEGLLLCPSDEYPRRLGGTLCAPHSYGINLGLAEVGGYLGSSLKLAAVADPIATVLFCELNGQRYNTHGVRYSEGGLERVAIHRHGGGANYTFLDGHTKWLRPESTEEPESLWGF